MQMGILYQLLLLLFSSFPLLLFLLPPPSLVGVRGVSGSKSNLTHNVLKLKVNAEQQATKDMGNTGRYSVW